MGVKKIKSLTNLSVKKVVALEKWGKGTSIDMSRIICIVPLIVSSSTATLKPMLKKNHLCNNSYILYTM